MNWLLCSVRIPLHYSSWTQNGRETLIWNQILDDAVKLLYLSYSYPSSMIIKVGNIQEIPDYMKLFMNVLKYLPVNPHFCHSTYAKWKFCATRGQRTMTGKASFDDIQSLPSTTSQIELSITIFQTLSQQQIQHNTWCYWKAPNSQNHDWSDNNSGTSSADGHMKWTTWAHLTKHFGTGGPQALERRPKP